MGSGTFLTVVQMTIRSIIIFLIALILIRIAGRWSFVIGSPIDNIIVILLDTIPSRSVVGPPFLAIMTTFTAIFLLRCFLS